MTTRNKASLTLLFEQGDTPTGTDFADFIDSQVNVAETSAQTIASPLTATEFIAPRVSATNVNVTGTFSADGAFRGTTATFSGTVSAAGVNTTGSVTGFGIISTGGVRVATDVSADAGTLYASANRWGFGVVSAAGTAQGTAAALTFTINEGKGVTDGSTTGFGLLANRRGWVQYLFNRGVSANLWPPTGGTINGQAADAVFSLAASTMYTIVHIGASAYAVK